MLNLVFSRSDDLGNSMLAASWTVAIATGVGVLVAGAALLFAYRQIKLTGEQMREAARQEAANSIARTRPYLGVDIVPGLQGSPVFDIVIENHGKTLAKDVRLRLAGAQFEAQSDDDEIGPALGRLLDAGFDLAPGARRRLIWRMGARKNATPPGEVGAPVKGEVVVTYAWKEDGSDLLREYEYRTIYDLTEYPKLIPSPSTGAIVTSSGEDAQRRNIDHALRAIAQHLGELRR